MRAGRHSMRTVSKSTGILLLGLLLPYRVGAAQIVEESFNVPMRVTAASGADIRQAIVVTVIRAAGTKPQPFLVLHHGRASSAAGFARMGRADYPANSRYFAERGFVVLVPTRIGYGVSGGPDIEYTGNCQFKRYAAGVAPAVSETRQVLAFAATLPYVDVTRGIVVGESFGGLIAMAAASSDIPGVIATVNISGGDGGDSLRHPDEPCRPDQLRETFAAYGRSNRVPTLWMYSRNDREWGPAYPRQWYTAFSETGGRGSFVNLPADKNNGHFIFNRNAVAWHPAFEAFLAQLGFAAPAR